MLVAHASDHITHAVIGGKKSIDFGISDDPAFFQILSSALYKDPMLAMVRETICNAWDAHIDSGRTNQPIIITLDDDYLIIKDFGNGIPDAMIGPIYGVYGASTKKNDGRQTGGFGLGCKSPFAYTDHFEVTSCHAGTKTIYNMSKSSAQVQGKPSIVPIASFPTTESGITVKIPLNQEKNNDRLDSLVNQVVFNGDILALFNQQQLPVLGLDNSECGLVLINDHATSGFNTNQFNNGRIYVRYGNVVYPVEKSQEFASLYNKLDNVLNSYYSCRLVMLAPPDSISITPSREALTLSDITVETIKTLMTKFLAVFFKNQELMARHKEMVVEYVDAAAKEEGETYTKLPLEEWKIPGIPGFASEKILRSTEDFALLEVLLRYSGRRGRLKAKLWFEYISQYLSDLALQGKFDRGLFHTWLRVTGRNLKHIDNPDGYRHHSMSKEISIATQWWRKQILAPLVQTMMVEVPDFDRKAMSYIGPNVICDGYKQKELIQVGRVFMKYHTHNLLHMLPPTLVVSHNSKHLPKRLQYVNRVEMGAKGTILKDAYFGYEVSRKKGEAEKVLEALKKIPGIEVLDLTGRLPHEQAAYEERQAEILKARADAAAGKKVHVPLVKKVKPGLVRFDFILDKNHKRIDTKILAESTDPVRITDPEFIALVSTGKEMRHVGRNTSQRVMYAAVMLYGDKGAVTNKQDAYERYREKGAVDLNDYLVDKIMDDVQNLPTLVEYSACDPVKMVNYLDDKIPWSQRRKVTDLVELLTKHPQLSSLVPDIKPLSEEDNLRWAIWSELRQNCPYARRKELQAAQEKVAEIPLKQEIVEFLDKLTGNEFLGLIDIEVASELLRSHRKDPVATAKIASFIQIILN